MERRIEPSIADNAAANDQHNFIRNNFGRVAAAVTLVGSLGALESSHIAGADGTPPPSNQPNVEMTIQNSQVSASDIINNKITIVADEHTKGYENVEPASCVFESTFWNSGKSADGKIFWFKDHNGKICRDSHSPTGWVKVAGGMTGRDCGNEAKPFGPAPGPVVKDVEILTTLNQDIKISATATAEASEPCGSAEASATATDTINLEEYLKDDQAGEIQIDNNIVSQATAEAEAEVTCETTPPPVIVTPPPVIVYTPPTTTTTIPTRTFTPVNISIANQNQEPIDENAQDVIAETVSGGNSGDNLEVTATVVDEESSQSAGTISQPTYDSSNGYWLETWTTPNDTTTDARVTVTVIDTTEQAEGAPVSDYEASSYTDIAVRQPS